MATDTDLALVTGAAGSIGCATIRSFTSRGIRVVTADKRPLPEAEARIVGRELDVDLSDDGRTRRAFAEIPGVGGLRHVVTVAGGGDADELGKADPATEALETFARVVENNLTSAFVTIRHAVPLLRANDGDRSITLVGSINAFGGYGAPGYSAAKAGLIGLAKALAVPLGADGIRINVLALGTVDTENLHALAEARGVELDLTAIASRAPLRRVLSADEVASALTAVALDMTGLTGTTVVLDNGQTLIR